MVPTALAREPVYFDYSLDPPLARVNLLSGEKQWQVSALCVCVCRPLPRIYFRHIQYIHIFSCETREYGGTRVGEREGSKFFDNFFKRVGG